MDGNFGAILSVLIYRFIGLNSDWISYIFIPAVIYIISGPGMIIGGRSLVKTYLAFAVNGFVYGAIIGMVIAKIKK